MKVRAGARWFIFWLLPIYAFVLQIVGTKHRGLMLVLGIVALASLIGLMQADRLRRAGANLRESFTGSRRLSEQLGEVRTLLQEVREEQREGSAGLQSAVTDSIADLSESIRRANDMAVHSVQRLLGARALYVDRMSRPVYFIHSHRPENPPHDRKAEVDRPTFTVPEVPVDEAPFIRLASLWVLNTRPWLTAPRDLPFADDIRILCGCVITPSDPLLKESLVVIGSTLYNKASTYVEKAALERNWLHYRFGREMIGPNGTQELAVIYGVAGSPRADRAFRPDPEHPPPPEGQRMTDYGLLTRIPNPTNGASAFVSVVGGCLLAGQLALTEWLSRPDTLHRLSVEHEDRPFQYVIAVDYQHKSSWNPLVDYGSLRVEDSTELNI